MDAYKFNWRRRACSLVFATLSTIFVVIRISIFVLSTQDTEPYDSAPLNDCFGNHRGSLVCSLPKTFYLEARVPQRSSLISKATKNSRKLSDPEILALAVTRSILKKPLIKSDQFGKIAFLFLVRGPIPFELMWERFLKGHEDDYAIYIQPTTKFSYEDENFFSNVFHRRDLPPPVGSFDFNDLFEVQKRLLAWALLDLSNHFFVLVSESTVPIRPFEYVYYYLMESQKSFIDGSLALRLNRKVKRAQCSKVFGLHRNMAVSAIANNYYKKLFDGACDSSNATSFIQARCDDRQLYLASYFQALNPAAISSYSIFYSEEANGKLRVFKPADITSDKVTAVQRIKAEEIPSRDLKSSHKVPCMRNGKLRPCFLFLQSVDSSAVDALLHLPQDILGY